MTLVVAQKVGGVIAVVSDTGVMAYNKRLPREKHLPKVCILTPDLTVSFAGNPDLAKRYINEIPERADHETAKNYFLRCHLDANHQVDFLIMSNVPQPEITRIHEGSVSPSLDAAWIGDKAAFEIFQRYRNSGPSISVTSVFENPLLISSYESETRPDNVTPQLLDAMRYVINDPSAASVFGFWVAVNNANGTFKYIDYAVVLTERQFAIALPRDLLQSTEPERAELREYAISCLVANESVSVLGLAYHHARAKLTYVYFGKVGRPLAHLIHTLHADEAH